MTRLKTKRSAAATKKSSKKNPSRERVGCTCNAKENTVEYELWRELERLGFIFIEEDFSPDEDGQVFWRAQPHPNCHGWFSFGFWPYEYLNDKGVQLHWISGEFNSDNVLILERITRQFNNEGVVQVTLEDCVYVGKMFSNSLLENSDRITLRYELINWLCKLSEVSGSVSPYLLSENE